MGDWPYWSSNTNRATALKAWGPSSRHFSKVNRLSGCDRGVFVNDGNHENETTAPKGYAREEVTCPPKTSPAKM